MNENGVFLYNFFFLFETLPISTGAGKHLVDTDNVPWVHSHTHVEGILGSHLGNVFVAANATSFEGLAGQLLSLQRDKVHAEGELICGSLLTTKIKDTDLGVWHTTAITGLGVRPVLAIPVAPSRAYRKTPINTLPYIFSYTPFP